MALGWPTSYRLSEHVHLYKYKNKNIVKYYNDTNTKCWLLACAASSLLAFTTYSVISVSEDVVHVEVIETTFSPSYHQHTFVVFSGCWEIFSQCKKKMLLKYFTERSCKQQMQGRPPALTPELLCSARALQAHSAPEPPYCCLILLLCILRTHDCECEGRAGSKWAAALIGPSFVLLWVFLTIKRPHEDSRRNATATEITHHKIWKFIAVQFQKKY